MKEGIYKWKQDSRGLILKIRVRFKFNMCESGDLENQIFGSQEWL